VLYVFMVLFAALGLGFRDGIGAVMTNMPPFHCGDDDGRRDEMGS